MSDSTSNTEQKSIYTDNRAVLGQGAIQATSGGTVQVANYTLDQEAINRSLDTVDKTVAGGFDLANTSLGIVAQGAGRVLDQVAGTETMLANAYADAKGQGALTQKILIVAVAGALFVAFMATKKD